MYTTEKKLIEHDIGNGITDNFQLDREGRKLFGKRFLGAFPSDRLPKLTTKQDLAIINLDNSSMPGSHWCAVMLTGPPTGDRMGEVTVYDSFNRSIKKILPDLAKEYRIIKAPATGKQKQKIAEQDCGPRSMAWLASQVFE